MQKISTKWEESKKSKHIQNELMEITTIKNSIEKGADIDALVVGKGVSLLYESVSLGKVNKTKFLLAHGANPNLIIKTGIEETPLHCVGTSTDKTVMSRIGLPCISPDELTQNIKLLLAYGANPESLDSNKNTSLHALVYRAASYKKAFHALLTSSRGMQWQERQGIKTILLLHKRKDCLVSLLPLNVIITYILPYYCPRVTVVHPHLKKSELAGKFIHEHKEQVRRMLTAENIEGYTAHDLALAHHDQELAQILDIAHLPQWESEIDAQYSDNM